MKYLTLDWAEQRDLRNEERNLCFSCFDLVNEGLSDEEIAERLGYDLPEIQENIDGARARIASYSRQ